MRETPGNLEPPIGDEAGERLSELSLDRLALRQTAPNQQTTILTVMLAVVVWVFAIFHSSLEP